MLLSTLEKYGEGDLETDDAPERDNNVHAEDNINTVTSATNSSGSPPYFSNTNALIKLVMKPSGNMVNMRCPAKGDPEPTIEWTKDGSPIDRKMGQVLFKKWAITLEDLITDDSGSYMCRLCNPHGCINFTSKLEVKGNYTRSDRPLSKPVPSKNKFSHFRLKI